MKSIPLPFIFLDTYSGLSNSRRASLIVFSEILIQCYVVNLLCSVMYSPRRLFPPCLVLDRPEQIYLICTYLLQQQVRKHSIFANTIRIDCMYYLTIRIVLVCKYYSTTVKKKLNLCLPFVETNNKYMWQLLHWYCSVYVQCTNSTYLLLKYIVHMHATAVLKILSSNQFFYEMPCLSFTDFLHHDLP